MCQGVSAIFGGLKKNSLGIGVSVFFIFRSPSNVMTSSAKLGHKVSLVGHAAITFECFLVVLANALSGLEKFSCFGSALSMDNVAHSALAKLTQGINLASSFFAFSTTISSGRPTLFSARLPPRYQT